MRSRNAHGKSIALIYFHPRNKIINAARVKSSEKRARKSSAPSDPTTRTIIATARIANPAHEGLATSFASHCLWLQTTYAENAGTKNP
jgi:hypothetical protein